MDFMNSTYIVRKNTNIMPDFPEILAYIEKILYFCRRKSFEQ